MLNAQADQELIFSPASGTNLQVLKISKPVDDTAWATSASGTLYTTDSNADTVDAITGSFKPGAAYTSIAPCNAANAPALACPNPPNGRSTPWAPSTCRPARSAASRSTGCSRPRAWSSSPNRHNYVTGLGKSGEKLARFDLKFHRSSWHRHR